jgi:predicted kinase
MEKRFSDFIPLEEGVNDPGIFKAVFMAGGPGSGKSFVVGNTALTALGLKLINSDNAFETALRKANMSASPEDIFSDKGQTIRARAKQLTQKQMDLALQGRLGLVIDGTGKDYQKILKQKQALETLGYETMLLFVNTDLETAQLRNSQRGRTLPDNVVEKMWKDVQNNLGKFQNIFGNNMIIVDNSEGSNIQGSLLSTYRKVMAWTRQAPGNFMAQRWMKLQRNRAMHEEIKEALKLGKLPELKPAKSPEQKSLTKKREKNTVFKSYKVGSQETVAEDEDLNEYNAARKTDTRLMFPKLRDKILAKTVHKKEYDAAKQLLKNIIDRKKKETGGRLRHSLGYYAGEVARQSYRNVNPKILLQLYNEEYNPQGLGWGTPEATAAMKKATPGEGKKTKDIKPIKTPISEEELITVPTDKEWSAFLHTVEVFGIDKSEIKELETQADNLTWDDMLALDMYDEDELEDEDYDDDGDVDIFDDVEITEVLSIQGRMKRRHNARRNRQKLKVARARRLRMSSSPDRIKMRAQRGARNMMKKRLARGRDVSAMPPAEKARLEKMTKRFAPLIAKIAVRMIPNMRRNELQRLKKRGSMKSQAAKKFKIAKGGSASKYKAKKFKIKKAGKK